MQPKNSLLTCSATMLLIGGSSLWTCLLDGAAAQTPEPAKKPPVVSAADGVAGTPPARVPADAKTTPETTGPDSESGRKLVDMLRARSEQDPKALAEMARGLGHEAKAKFQFGRQIAVGQAREIRMTQQRVELRKQSDKKMQERAKLRTQLDEEIEQIRQQFQADKAQCERQLVDLINSYRPRLQQLKDEATRCTELADKTDAKLAEVRREILALEQQQRLAAQGKPAKPPRLLLVDLELDENDEPVKPRVVTTPTVATTPSQSAEQILKDLD